jgi:phage baseplate assembly protein V
MSEVYTQQFHPAFRTGLVYAVQISPFPACQVQFPDRGGIVTTWLQISYPCTGPNKFFWLPAIGDQVKVSMDENDEYGSVDGSLYSLIDGPPAGASTTTFIIEFSDGSVLMYDTATHALTVTLGSSATAILQSAAGGSIALDSSGGIQISVATTLSITQGTGDTDSLALVSLLVAAFNSHVHSADDTPPTVQWTPATVATPFVKVT